jgi:hypothetical protein
MTFSFHPEAEEKFRAAIAQNEIAAPGRDF